jgi:hypothetical protein
MKKLMTLSGAGFGAASGRDCVCHVNPRSKTGGTETCLKPTANGGVRRQITGTCTNPKKR